MKSRSAPALFRATATAAAVALAGCPATPYPEARVDLTADRAPTAATPPETVGVLRFSIAAMQSPQDTFAGYSGFLDVLARRVGTKVELVQRRTYAEVNDLLATGKLDAAIVCTGGYLDLQRQSPGAVEVLAVPVIAGVSTYRAYLVVPASSRDRSLADLRGKRFAYTDELSLSGCAWTRYALRKAGQDARTFFGSTEFTRSHDRSIEAVAKGLVDGAVVDSLIFDQLARARPELAARVRIIERSAPFGGAPVVVSTRLSRAERERLRAVLLGLDRDPDAAEALRLAGIDRFAAPAPGLYDESAKVMEALR